MAAAQVVALRLLDAGEEPPVPRGVSVRCLGHDKPQCHQGGSSQWHAATLRKAAGSATWQFFTGRWQWDEPPPAVAGILREHEQMLAQLAQEQLQGEVRLAFCQEGGGGGGKKLGVCHAQHQRHSHLHRGRERGPSRSREAAAAAAAAATAAAVPPRASERTLKQQLEEAQQRAAAAEQHAAAAEQRASAAEQQARQARLHAARVEAHDGRLEQRVQELEAALEEKEGECVDLEAALILLQQELTSQADQMQQELTSQVHQLQLQLASQAHQMQLQAAAAAAAMTAVAANALACNSCDDSASAGSSGVGAKRQRRDGS